MAIQRTIVGLGEMLLVETPESSQPAGLAATVAMHAVRMGQVGVAISRIGQDPQADELLGLLKEAGVDTTHVQNDPDLPTGRVIERPVGGKIARYLESKAAFDNLQWDSDLEDIAQQADGVVYGLLTRRSGQTRSEENRFLAACGAALKLLNTINRTNDDPERGQLMSALERADAAVMDPVTIELVLPGSSRQPFQESAPKLLRTVGLSLLVGVESRYGAGKIKLCSADQLCETNLADNRCAFDAWIVALLQSILRGRDLTTSTETAARIASFTTDHPDEAVPEDLAS